MKLSYFLRSLIIFDVPIQSIIVFTNYHKMLNSKQDKKWTRKKTCFPAISTKIRGTSIMKDHELYFSRRINKVAEILVLLISLWPSFTRPLNSVWFLDLISPFEANLFFNEQMWKKQNGGERRRLWERVGVAEQHRIVWNNTLRKRK